MQRAPDFRPFSLSSTDNKLCAAAMRHVFESFISEAIPASQRGFIKDRIMLQNVLEIETTAMIEALEAPSPSAAVLLYDFAVAVPSISHQYLRDRLPFLGMPLSSWMRSYLFAETTPIGYVCKVRLASLLP